MKDLCWQETLKKTTAAEAAGKVDAAWSRAQPLANAAGVNDEKRSGSTVRRWERREMEGENEPRRSTDAQPRKPQGGLFPGMRT